MVSDILSSPSVSSLQWFFFMMSFLCSFSWRVNFNLWLNQRKKSISNDEPQQVFFLPKPCCTYRQRCDAFEKMNSRVKMKIEESNFDHTKIVKSIYLFKSSFQPRTALRVKTNFPNFSLYEKEVDLNIIWILTEN